MSQYLSKVQLPGSDTKYYIKDTESQSLIGVAIYAAAQRYSKGDYIMYRGLSDDTPQMYRVTTEVSASTNTGWAAMSNYVTATSVALELTGTIDRLRGKANGLAMLDSEGKLPVGELPDTILGQLTYGGNVEDSNIISFSSAGSARVLAVHPEYDISGSVTVNNAATDITKTSAMQGILTLTGLGWESAEGMYFIMSVNSTFAGLDLNVGDWLISTGAKWTKIDNTDAVTSVNNKIGAIKIDPTIARLTVTNSKNGSVSLTSSSVTYGKADVGDAVNVVTGLSGTTSFLTSALGSASCNQYTLGAEVDASTETLTFSSAKIIINTTNSTTTGTVKANTQSITPATQGANTFNNATGAVLTPPTYDLATTMSMTAGAEVVVNVSVTN